MPMSMTGYGRHKATNKGYEISVEIKSVNHRFFDANIRTPRSFTFLEEMVRKYLATKINRGKLDVYIYISSLEEGEKSISLNKPIIKNYLSVFKEISEEFSIPYDLTVSKIAKYQDIFDTDYKEYDTDEVFSALLPVLEKAVSDFLSMRLQEGNRLCQDMLERANGINLMTLKIMELLPASIQEYESKLRDKMLEHIDLGGIDENRLINEVAIFADKVATFEETTRLSSHFVEFLELIKKDQPIGKKLDFIVQEMNREINTICSKCQSYEISKIGIDVKTEIEAIREQVQNLE